jgi:hypothetical protein
MHILQLSALRDNSRKGLVDACHDLAKAAGSELELDLSAVAREKEDEIKAIRQIEAVTAFLVKLTAKVKKDKSKREKTAEKKEETLDPVLPVTDPPGSEDDPKQPAPDEAPAENPEGDFEHKTIQLPPLPPVIVE